MNDDPHNGMDSHEIAVNANCARHRMQCACSVRERDSGHRSDCAHAALESWSPEFMKQAELTARYVWDKGVTEGCSETNMRNIFVHDFAPFTLGQTCGFCGQIKNGCINCNTRALEAMKATSVNGDCGHPHCYVGEWEDGKRHCWECEYLKLDENYTNLMAVSDSLSNSVTTLARAIDPSMENPEPMRLVQMVHEMRDLLNQDSRRINALIHEINAAKRLHVAAVEFVNDWRKGDFELPSLAQHDANALAQRCDEYIAAIDSARNAAKTGGGK